MPIPAPGNGIALKLLRSRFGFPWLSSPTLGFKVTDDQLIGSDKLPFLLKQLLMRSSFDEVVKIGSESIISCRSRQVSGIPPEKRTAYEAISAISRDWRIALLSVPFEILRLVASTDTSVSRASIKDVAAAKTTAMSRAEPFLFHRPWYVGVFSIMTLVFTVRKGEAIRIL